ncbi:MAG TPA: transglycosylase SLT domain-containing protein, partial [Polyangia bacterium]
GIVQAAPAMGMVRHQARRYHRIGCAALLLSLLMPPLVLSLGGLSRGPAPVEIWNAQATDIGWTELPSITVARPRADAASSHGFRLAGGVTTVGLAMLGLGILLAVGRLGGRARRLRGLCAALPVIKRVGRVRICAGDDDRAPFAARAGGLAYIVVPTSLLAEPHRLRLVIAHEAHHHRRGDLHLATWLAGLQAFWFWNPALQAWARALEELEDLDCDQAAIRRQRVSAVAYARCLVWAAEASQLTRGLGAVRGMAAPSTQALERRISALTTAGNGPRNFGRRRRGFTAVVATTLLAMILGGTWAATAAVSDRRVSAEEVAKFAQQIHAQTGFPVLASAPVVEAVNRRVATPEARERTRAALTRMAAHRPMIEDVLRERGLPLALVAIPFQESAFDPAARTDRPVHIRSAGLWQLLPSTAQRLGLEVSASRDDRLDPRRATEAAANLLRENFIRFGDWPLAVAAYNMGAKLLTSVTAGLNVDDARARILAATDKEYGRYLAGAMAAVILIETPHMVD